MQKPTPYETEIQKVMKTKNVQYFILFIIVIIEARSCN